ncbi:polysaccharide deacetylase family protein [Rhizobium tubonense]|uniref:Polysaccharide deacetylase n=1 Tax=Rhizobium tubonense TaxID=484088 RepID=A0A2W4ENH8_9HYPH|nr:polysaccharide deacetylase family protein [Rhizobium tubonense]PZM15156.1 polysaccharide deacetylase [Rhizobium tubonense]
MSDSAIWRPLRDELLRFAAAGRTANLWLRDDDAIEPTAPLDRLLDLTGNFAVPLALAVIPAVTGEALAMRLQRENRVAVIVHGWTHDNHAADDRKKQELGPERPGPVVLAELKAGFDKLKRLYPRQFTPVLVPPWNRIAPTLLPSLGDLGYRAVSVYGQSSAMSSIALVNSHVDIMNWHGVRGCRPHAELVANLVTELANRFDGGSEPIGVLTHHLVHDAAAWDFIAQLFEETKDSSAVGWRGIAELLN